MRSIAVSCCDSSSCKAARRIDEKPTKIYTQEMSQACNVANISFVRQTATVKARFKAVECNLVR